MFGYITANTQELKVKDFQKYRSYYCGVCHSLKTQYGRAGQISLSYDTTFVALLLSSLYEPKDSIRMAHCIPHPIEKRPMRQNPYIDYAADMNLLLTYFKCLDDWQDERKFSRLLYAGLLKPSIRKIKKRYPGKVKAIRDALSDITAAENRDEENPDIPAGLFGNVMAEILIYDEDIWSPTLGRLGFFLGKYIYLLDAYDDLEDDLQNDQYNVFRSRKDNPAWKEEALQMLTMMAAECSAELEKLPLLRDIDLIRNIIYSGIWSKYHK